MATDLKVIATKLTGILSNRPKVSDIIDLPDGKKRKLIILKPKLVLKNINKIGSTSIYKVTITNEGNASAYSGKCDLFAGTSVLTFKQTRDFVLHPGQTKILAFSYALAAGESLHAFLYDPVADPFPVLSAQNFIANQKNLVLNGKNPAPNATIAATWKQFDNVNGTFTAVTEANKTWEGRTVSPVDARFTSYFKPMATVTKESQLVQQISLVSPAIDAALFAEIQKGNVSYTVSALLSVYDHAPSANDEADFIFRFTSTTAQETGYQTHIDWREYSFTGIVPKNPDKAILTLRTKRNTGSNNDGFFANISFQLKHRQVASIQQS